MSRRGAILQDYGGRFEPMPQDAQLAAAHYYQQDQQFRSQLKERQKEKSDREAADLIKGIGIDHIGDNTIDLLTDKQIQGVQDKLLDMHMKGATTTDLMLYAQRELPKISNGHTIAKNKYNQIKSGVIELGKDYPTGNLEQARSMSTKEMLKDVLNFDENGNATGYKDPSIIPEKNYVTPLVSDENISQWYTPSGALETHIKSLPLTKIGESKKVRDARGREIDNIWEGQGSVFSKLKVDPITGATIGQEIKSETIPIGKNPDGTINNAVVLPQDEFNVLTGTPQAKADFSIKFSNHLKDLKIDPKSLDPRAKDILQRQFAHDWLSSTGIEGSSFITKQADKQPLPPRVSVKINNGANSVDAIDVYTPTKVIVDEHFNNKDNYKPIVTDNGIEVYGAVPVNSLDDKYQEAILAIAKSKDKEVESIGDIFLKKTDDGGIGVIKKADNSLITTMTETGANIQANTPLGQKAKQEAVNKAKGNKTTPSDTNKWDKYKRQ